MRHTKILVPMLIVFILTVSGCSSGKFDPYRHMTRILTMKSAEQFNSDRDAILEHIDTSLQQEFIDRLSVTIYDESYSISERNVYMEQTADTVKLLAEYDCTSVMGGYLKVVYFEYENDILIDYYIQKIEKSADF